MKWRMIIIGVSCLLSACVNSFQQNYHSYLQEEPQVSLQFLTPGATPMLYKSNDVQADVADAKNKGYIVIGEARFNGELEPDSHVIEQAKAVKATMVIYASRYTDTQTVTRTMYLPNSSTTSTSGQVNNKKGTATYNEVSKTSGTRAVPVATQIRNFEQQAVFLVKKLSAR